MNLNFRFLSYFYIFLSILIIIASIISYATYSDIPSENSKDFFSYFSNDEFFWPVPGFNKVTSEFGPRIAPASGASYNHSGIDISATEGSNIYSVLSGKVVYVGFQGANGNSIVIESGNFSITYAHISPKYLVSLGEYILKGEKIANVGPKYVDYTSDNPYKDSTGKHTNGATTGPHLHLTIKKDGLAVNPLNYFK